MFTCKKGVGLVLYNVIFVIILWNSLNTFFLHCNVFRVIWDFFISGANELLNSTKISEIFSLHHALKFRFPYLGWNSLVLPIFWTLWLNRNAIIFRNSGRNINSIFHHILLLVSCWTDILAARQDNLSPTLSQVKQDWDQAHSTQDIFPMAPISGFGESPTSAAISGSANPIV